MTQGEGAPEPSFSIKAVVAACIVMARYLRTRDPRFANFLSASLLHAGQAGLDQDDLKLIHLMLDAVGTSDPDGLKPSKG